MSRYSSSVSKGLTILDRVFIVLLLDGVPCYTCVGCNSHNGNDTDTDLVCVHLSPITSIHVLLAPSCLELTYLSSNLFCLSSDCDLACLGYVPVAFVASLATTSSLSQVPYQALHVALFLF